MVGRTLLIAFACLAVASAVPVDQAPAEAPVAAPAEAPVAAPAEAEAAATEVPAEELAAPVNDVPEGAVDLVAAESAATTTNFPFTSGVIEIMAGTETVVTVPAGFWNPLIFFGPVEMTGENSRMGVAAVPRTKKLTAADGTISFSVTAGVAPCDFMANKEKVSYFIVSSNNGNLFAMENGVQAAIRSQDVVAGDGINKRGYFVKFQTMSGLSNCLASIQTRNTEGFLQVNTMQHASDTRYQQVRIKGTRNGGVRNDAGVVTSLDSVKEHVALMCFPGVTENVVEMKRGDMKLQVYRTNALMGTGVFALKSSSNYNNYAMTGIMDNVDPYHIRAYPTSSVRRSEGITVFKVSEDTCGHYESAHAATDVLVVGFKA